MLTNVRKPRKIDIHTHILPERWPDLRERYGYGGFVRLEHEGPGCAQMMIDDKPENVEGAKAAGLAGHRCTGIDGLRREFRTRGLLRKMQ